MVKDNLYIDTLMAFSQIREEMLNAIDNKNIELFYYLDEVWEQKVRILNEKTNGISKPIFPKRFEKK